MAFGRVIIRTESGETEEYEFAKPTTSVGRLPGNDIVLNTSAASRYHAQFDVVEGVMCLVDLGTVNGTFVNDQAVEANIPIPLSDGDVITIGDVRLAFYTPAARERYDLTPRAVPIEEATVSFRLVLDEPQQVVAPGARLQLTMIIDNRSVDTQTYTVQIGGLEWAKANRREVQLAGGEQAQVVISVRPPRSSHTRPGIYPLTVRVGLKDDPGQTLEAVREIEVVGYAGLAIAVQEGRQNGVYHLAVQNQGNVDVDVQLGGYNREGLLRYSFDPSRLRLDPGATRQVTLNVRPKKMHFGQPRKVEFAIVARSLDHAGYRAPVLAHYTLSSSMLPLLGLLPVLLGVLVVVVLAILFATGTIRLPLALGSAPTPTPTLTESPTAEVPTPGLPTETPVVPTEEPTPIPRAGIIDFTAVPAEVFYRVEDEVEFQWNVGGDIDVLELRYDATEELIFFMSENVSSGVYSLPTGDMELGTYVVRLTITGVDGSVDSLTTEVRIVPLVCQIDSFQTALAYVQPDLSAETGPPLTSPDVIPIRRTHDPIESAWVLIRYNRAPDEIIGTLEGWVPAYQVRCNPLGILAQVVIDPNVEPGPAAPPTESGGSGKGSPGKDGETSP